jgi:hypothetical protein
MVDTYTIADVTTDLRYLMTLTNFFDTDEEGFWVIGDDKERYKHKLDSNDPGREVVLVQDPMPRGDYLVFNPFSEGFGKQNPATKRYYQTLRIATNQTIMVILFHVARSILAAKEASAKGEDSVVTPAVMRMSSVPTGKRQTVYDIIDEDMITEFKKLCDRINDEFIHVPYIPQSMTAKLTCAILTAEDWDTKYVTKDIRKRSAAAFKALLMGILGITKPEELSQFSVKYSDVVDGKSAPQLHTTLMVYMKLYQRFNDVVADAYATDGTPSDRYTVDLGRFNETIERLPYAYAIAKHMMQPTAPTVKPTSTQTSDTSGMRFANGQGQTNAQGPQGRFGSAATVDNYGRPMRGPQAAPMMPETGASRFRAPADQQGYDPFSPVPRQNQMGQMNPVVNAAGSSFSNTGQPMFSPGFAPGMTPMMAPGMTPFANPATMAAGSAFSGGQQMGYMAPAGGFNNFMPSNFGDPGTRRFSPR